MVRLENETKKHYQDRFKHAEVVRERHEAEKQQRLASELLTIPQGSSLWMAGVNYEPETGKYAFWRRQLPCLALLYDREADEAIPITLDGTETYFAAGNSAGQPGEYDLFLTMPDGGVHEFGSCGEWYIDWNALEQRTIEAKRHYLESKSYWQARRKKPS